MVEERIEEREGETGMWGGGAGEGVGGGGASCCRTLRTAVSPPPVPNPPGKVR